MRSVLKKTMIVAGLLLASVPAHATKLTGELLATSCMGNVPDYVAKDKKQAEKFARFCNTYINAWDDARWASLQGTETYCPLG